MLNNYDIRAAIDDRNETIGKKIRENELKRIPYLLIVGEKEAESGTVSVRKQGGVNVGTLAIDDFVKMIKDEINQQLN